eukprot:scaffold325223_cov80-Tisochrysis_lutea.AAC.1
MAAEASIGALLRSYGFGMITMADGAHALGASLSPRTPMVHAMMIIEWDVFSTQFVHASRLLSNFTIEAQRTENSHEAHVVVPRAVVISLDEVLEVARSTIGSSSSYIDADVPLMESGLDSLGVVELRSRLQALVGDAVLLPATLVFEQPTARAIASLFD